MFRILRQVAVVASGTGFVAVSGVIALAFNARSLGASDYGVLATIQAYVALVAAIATLESWQPVIRLGSRAKSKLGPILSSGVALDLTAAAAAVVIAVAGVWTAGALVGVPDQYRILATIYSLSLMGGVAGTPKGYFRLKGRYDVLVGNQVAQGIALVAVSVVLWFTEAPLLAYVVCLALLGPLYNLSILIRMILHARLEGITLQSPRRHQVRRYFPHFARMALGSGLVSTLVASRRHFAQLLVAGLVGGEATGVYAIGARLASMVNRLSGPVNQVIFPEIFRMSAGVRPERLVQAVRRMTLAVAVVAVLFVAFGALVSEYLVMLVAGAGYGAAAAIFVALLAAECLELGGIHLNAFIQSRRGTKPLIFIGAGSCLAMVAIGAILASRFDGLGVAIGMLAASAFTYASMTAIAFRATAQAQRRVPAAAE